MKKTTDVKEIDELLLHCRNLAEEKEGISLHPKACFSKDHSRHFGKEDDHRLPYKRDVDRIIHSKAYSRYIDKTQVAYLIQNDHITHRSLHVQLVSNFARGIAEILRLNGDLVEAIALGHDVGHPPFGHEGEGYLSNLSQEFGNGVFTHPLQSCKLFSEIEPLNLGLAVYDGFSCHDGGMCGTKFVPNFGKSWQDHFNERKKKIEYPDNNIWPATLEGCLVKMCDTISYLGRDLEDAISLGLLQREEVPKTLLGVTNRKMLSNLAADIIKNSYDQDYIAFSEEVYQALKTIRKFNFEKIYSHPKLKTESKKIERCYRILFEYLLNDFKENNSNSYLYQNFLHNKEKEYLLRSSPVALVIDYISGMTDTYFVRTLEKLIVPQRIQL